MATNRQLAQQARRNREKNSIQSRVSTIPISLPVLASPQQIGTTSLTKRQLGQAMRQFRRHQLMTPERLQINPAPPQAQITNLASTNQQLLQSLQQLPIARRPLLPRPIHTISSRHSCGRCNISCSFCGAEHWIEERSQGSSQRVPKFSTCCMGGAIMMDKFDDPPEPLYSLLMDCTPGICSAVDLFANNKQLENFVITFGIITMPLLSVPLVSKETYPFMALMEYILFVSKVN